MDDLPKLKRKFDKAWDVELDVQALREYTAHKFDWLYKSGAKKYIRVLAPALLASRLRQRLGPTTISTVEQVKRSKEPFH